MKTSEATEPQPKQQLAGLTDAEKIATLVAKANSMAGMRRICHHPEFERKGGLTRRAILHRGEGHYIREDGSNGFDPDWVEYAAPIYSYRCTICGGMFTESEHTALRARSRL